MTNYNLNTMAPTLHILPWRLIKLYTSDISMVTGNIVTQGPFQKRCSTHFGLRKCRQPWSWIATTTQTSSYLGRNSLAFKSTNPGDS